MFRFAEYFDMMKSLVSVYWMFEVTVLYDTRQENARTLIPIVITRKCFMNNLHMQPYMVIR